MKTNFDLLLFSTNTHLIRKAVASGVAAIVLDWDQQGKEERQAGADTQINRDTLEDLRRIRPCTDAPIICRTNSYGPGTVHEIEDAIAFGADEILLPMVRTVSEVEQALRLIGGRCGLGIMVETIEAMQLADQLGQLPLKRVYVGLNDLAIARKTESIFTALIDGTIERIRPLFHVPFGLGGLTLPDRGYPIPCRLIMSELARLRCTFTVLRRSFYADTVQEEVGDAIKRILVSMDDALGRSEGDLMKEHEKFSNTVEASIQLTMA